ncbi:hypothetical protein L1049_015604 [Liquidambar formosana]|uniref:Uncharacterized protein n=1 Tax=Liquidambar formosana TaxID=63359 RepID=A0AAP0S502_LIQFO
MKQIEVDAGDVAKRKWTCQPPPPPPPPLPRGWAMMKPAAKAVTKSVTKQEIERFWKQKRMEEEDHLLAGLKAAARIRARRLTEEDYKRFEESLKHNRFKEEHTESNSDNEDDENKERRVGIKDWWTKSKYAYLNQPANETMDKPKRASTYIPNTCFYKPPSCTAAPNQAAYLGVF